MRNNVTETYSVINDKNNDWWITVYVSVTLFHIKNKFIKFLYIYTLHLILECLNTFYRRYSKINMLYYK